RLRRVQVTLQRVAPARLRARVASSYQLVLHSEGEPRCRVRLGEHPVEGVQIAPREHVALLSPGTPLVLDGTLSAARHGRFALTRLSLRKETRLGLCAVTEQLTCESKLRVYPDLPMG